MTKKDKYIILYLAVTLGLGIIHLNYPQNEWLSLAIPIFILYAFWDVLCHPLKYSITLDYLSKEIQYYRLDIKCYYTPSNPTSLFCKVHNSKLLDGYKEIPQCVGYGLTQTISEITNSYTNILNVNDLLNCLSKKADTFHKQYDYWYTDCKDKTKYCFILMTILDIVLIFIYLSQHQIDTWYYYY